MPPKKVQDAPPAFPEIEDEVVLPEDIDPVPEPVFCLALGHLYSHTFRAIRKEPRIGDESPTSNEDAEDTETVIDFDPVAVVVERAKMQTSSQEELLARKVMVVDREELHAQAKDENGEDKTLAFALRVRLEKERSARSRAKSNAAKRKAIADAETAKEITEEPQQEDEEVCCPVPQADFLLLSTGYPADINELQELASEGILESGVVDVWATVYMAGETISSTENGNSAENAGLLDDPVLHGFDLPPQVDQFYQAIRDAPNTSELASFTVCTLRESQNLVNPPADTELVSHVENVILEALGREADCRRMYTDWIASAEKVVVPTLDEKFTENRLYHRLMSAVDPSHHDVPLFLHCLTEQVERTLCGEAQQHEDELAMSDLADYLSAICDEVLPGKESWKGAFPKRLAKTGPAKTDEVTQVHLQSFSQLEENTIIPFLDRSRVAHNLASGGESAEVGTQAVDEAANALFRELRAAGVHRNGLPDDSFQSRRERDALATRLYPFAPSVSSAEMEQLVLLQAFEETLSRAQPERRGKLSFSDRFFRERIPANLVTQTLQAAFVSDPFVSTSHLPRWDALLLALHYRSPGGRVLWHSWRGDLLSEFGGDCWQQGLFTQPTYHDWASVFGGRSGESPVPKYILQGFDSRECGYCGIFEKLATPPDGSVILVTKSEKGIKASFPVPANDLPKTLESETLDRADRRSAMDDAASSITVNTVVMGAKARMATESRLRSFRCETSPAKRTRLARVMKNGHTFGIIADDSFGAWLAVEKAKMQEQSLSHSLAEQQTALVGQVADQADDDGNGDTAGGSVVQNESFPFEKVPLGCLWISLEGGARVTARMHHERVLQKPRGTTSEAQALADCGVLFTYTMASGQVVQVSGDGATRLSFPLELSEGMVAKDGNGGSAPAASEQHKTTCDSFVPGCPDDLEISRAISPDGALCRRLLSGRVEVYYADGTTVGRNPTYRELKAITEEFDSRPGGTTSHALELLQKLQRVYEDKRLGMLTEEPTQCEKAAGIPGHWVVTCPDGRVFGRAPLSQDPLEAPYVFDSTPRYENVNGGVDGSPTDEVTQANVLPNLQDLVEGYVCKDGAVYEYEIAAVPAALQEDLQTKHRAVTNAVGLASFEDPDGFQRISFHSDGTQITRTKSEDGCWDVDVSKEPFAHLRCEMRDRSRRTTVECADGAFLEVVPTRNGDEWQVQVALRCRSGATIVSTGNGEVNILTQSNTADEEGGAYTALLREGTLVLRGANQEDALGEFTLHIDQSLDVPEPRQLSTSSQELYSPRCPTTGMGYRWPGTEFSAPRSAPPPRLFVIYGDGEAEELLEASVVQKLLADFNDNPGAMVVEGPDMAECKAHTIFETKLPDAPIVPPMGSMAVPESFETAGSSCYSILESSKDQPTRPAAAPVTVWRHFIEYPAPTNDMREKFKGTLKQYRQWEADQLSRSRFVMQGPEATKSKKDVKGGKKDGEKKEKTKKGRKKTACVEAPADLSTEKPPDPAFVQDIHLSGYDHLVHVLRLRKEMVEQPSGEARLNFAFEQRAAKFAPPAAEGEFGADGNNEGQLSYALRIKNVKFEILTEMPTLFSAVAQSIKAAVAAEAGANTSPDQVRLALSGGSLIVEATILAPEGSLAGEIRQRFAGSESFGVAVLEAVARVEGIEDVLTGPLSIGNLDPGVDDLDDQACSDYMTSPISACRAPSTATSFMMDAESALAEQLGGVPELPKPVAEEGFAFSYWKSEMGVQWLIESGEFEFDRKVRSGKGAKASRSFQQPCTQRSPWNPLLVGEEPPEETTMARQSETEIAADDRRGSAATRSTLPMAEEEAEQRYYYLDAPQENPEYKLPFETGSPYRTMQDDDNLVTPQGPHPDKKSSKWDHKGDLRRRKPPVSQAIIDINTDYLEIEGPTDRRVRTSSIAHKKNATKAPNVQHVRKTGTHAIGRGTELSAKELIGDIQDVGFDGHWKLSSTMQGLGDSNILVSVVPGTSRFGPLCLGKIYRMFFVLRNLDVDCTGYVITSNSDFVQICHAPGEIIGDGSKIAGKIAPGISKKVIVEIAAHTPIEKIDHIIEIAMKAHRISLPVTASILDVEEYEKVDATEMAIHQRHIGRTCERGDPVTGAKPPAVELVADPIYCKRAFAIIERRMARRGNFLPPIQGSGRLAGYPS